MTASHLVCHPNTQSELVAGISVEFFQSKNKIHLLYQLTGEILKLAIPPKQQPNFTNGLWQHTCFEVFIADVNAENYYEFNFSPSTQWAAYAFIGYRQNCPCNTNVNPDIKTVQTNTQLELRATIDIPADLTGRSLQLGLSAVVEQINGDLSYWALCHPANEPNFHHRDGFILPLNPLN